MEARLVRVAPWIVVALLSLGASHRTPNFVVSAPSDRFAREVGEAAEAFRRDLAIHWLGKELPRWSQPCPIMLKVGEHLGAGGATSFVFDRGEVYGWRMTIQGSEERILDSVLPHEVTHTIFASHFRQPLPRWADEGACTTVEHPSERAKQRRMLVEFLQTGRGIPFSQMFQMKEYPPDVMPLYSQGYSLARFLIEQGGPRKYIEYVGEGLEIEDWVAATQRHYGFSNLNALQTTWLDWVRQGSPALNVASIAQNDRSQGGTPGSATQLAGAATPGSAGGNDVVVRAQNQNRLGDFLSKLNPLRRASPSSTAKPSVYDPYAQANPAAQAPRGAGVFDRSRGAPHRALDEAPPWPGPAGVSPASAHGAQPTNAGPPRVDLGVPSSPVQFERTRQAATASEVSMATPNPAGRPRQVLLEWTRPDAELEQAAPMRNPGVTPPAAREGQPIYFDAPPQGRDAVVR